MRSICRKPVNSVISEDWCFKKLAGFGFQSKPGSNFIFYKYSANFPKLFLIKSVEKKGNAIRASLSIAYPHCVNI
jgi:hypothetical protein